ncbi:serine--tRNA ligase, partial [bacterium]|nr:serine--tRNA ligase [bacterium]
MLDLKFIVENPDIVKRACALKKEQDNVDRIIDLYRVRKIYVAERDELRRKLNEISAEIGKLAKKGGDVSSLRAEAKKISDEVK